MELDRLRRVDRADVHKAGALAGSLSRSAAGVTFAHHDGYDGPAVATTLPVSDEPVVSPGGAVPPFFAGLLPEGRRLTAVRTAAKTSADDELTLLLAVGGDTVGDVQVVPAGEPPAPVPPVLEDVAVGEVSFRDLLASVLGDPAAVDRIALPGVQDKVSAAMIAVPVATASTHYILKIDPPEYPHLSQNEAFFLEAARASGLAAARAHVVHDAEDHPGLLVERFDRVSVDGDVRRRALEDGCQVLGRYPADKYLLTAEQVLAGLAGVCPARPVAALDGLKQVAFAYLTGNGDQHAKNLAVLEVDGEWRIAPAYDVPSSHPYGDTTMALTVNSKDREDITGRDFLALGAALGIPERAVARALGRLAAATDRWLEDLDTLPFDQRRRQRLRRLVRDRASKLA